MTIEELKALEAAATPGPWVAKLPGYRGDTVSGCMDPCAEVLIEHDEDYPYTIEDLLEADADFIAAARTMLPRLIAVAEAAKAYDDLRGAKGLGMASPQVVHDKRQVLIDAIAALEAP